MYMSYQKLLVDGFLFCFDYKCAAIFERFSNIYVYCIQRFPVWEFVHQFLQRLDKQFVSFTFLVPSRLAEYHLDKRH